MGLWIRAQVTRAQLVWLPAERNCVFLRDHSGPQVTRRQCRSELNLTLPRIPSAAPLCTSHLLFTLSLCFRLLTNQGSAHPPLLCPLQVLSPSWDTALSTFFFQLGLVFDHPQSSVKAKARSMGWAGDSWYKASGNSQVWAGSLGCGWRLLERQA